MLLAELNPRNTSKKKVRIRTFAVRIRTFAVRIRTCFRVRFLKNSRANQMRASDGLAYWTVIGHPKVHTKIGFAANNQVSGPV